MGARPAFRLRAAISAVIVAVPAAALAEPVGDYRIGAGPLAQALRELGRQGQVDVLFTPDTVVGRHARALSGRHTAAAALSLVLGEDLEVVRTGPASFLVRRRPTTAPEPVSGRHEGPLAEVEVAETIVTALKRPDLLQRIPASLTLISGDRLARLGGLSFADVVRQVPSVAFTENGTGQRRITMRGVQSSGENTVGLYIGDTPLTGPSTATSDVSQMSPDPAMVDVERIEALRGPQGTLYGAGAMSGALRIMYAAPELSRRSGSVTLRGERVEAGAAGRAVEAMANLPLVAERLAVRLVAYDQRTAGYVDNVRLGDRDVNGGRTSGVRLGLLYAPRPSARVRLLALHQRQRVHDTAFGFAGLGGRTTDNAMRLPFPNDLTLVSVGGEMAVGRLALAVTASGSRWDTERFIDSTRTAAAVIAPATYCPALAQVAACDAAQQEAYRAYVRARLPAVGRQPARVDSWTQEARLSSSGGALSWTAGVFVERRRDYSESGVYVADAATGEALIPAQRIFFRTIAVDTDQTALFGEARLELSAHWTATVGLRRYAYAKSAEAQVLQSSYLNGALAGPLIRRRTRQDGVAGKFNLAFQATPGLLLYAQVAEGFRPGGVNTVPNLPEPLVVFRPDSVRSYEFGLKGRRRDAGAVLNLAVFRTDWTDMQARARRPSFTYVANAGTSRIEGLEVEAEAGFGPHLRGHLAVSLIDARLTSDQSTEGAGEGRRGDRIPFEPRLLASAALTYQRPLAGGGEAYVRLGYVYTGRSASQFNRASPTYETMGGFGLVDLRAGGSRGVWRADLWVTNLFANRGDWKVESDVNVERLTLEAQPRTVGLALRRSF